MSKKRRIDSPKPPDRQDCCTGNAAADFRK